MSLLARLDPGDGVTGLVFIVVLQTSMVILLAALLGRALFRWRAEARHVLWLGTLVLVLISPAVAAIAGRSGVGLWVITLPVTGDGVRPARGNQRPSHEVARSAPPRLPAELPTGSVAPDTDPLQAAMAVTSVEPASFDATRPITQESNRRGSPLMGGLTLLWAFGALIGLVRVAVGWTRTAALWRSASILDPIRHGPTLERVRNALGVAVLPPVIISPALRAPVAVCLWRPWIILPEGLAESLASDSLRDVLVHECAHVIRLDAWVGLLQRLACVLFWPHPLVHFASAQLTRAREEICDNYVLRVGDPRDYARTLLALTEQCMPLGAVRPGHGILGARWTLADRVAGLLDTRRVPMLRTTFPMKVAVWVSLAVAGLAAAGVRLDRSARAERSQPKPAEPQAAVAPAVWSVEGAVVDERGQPVAGAVVRSAPDFDVVDESKTAADGAFALALGGKTPYIRGVVAETEGGARIGLVRFDPVREPRPKDQPVRIVLKPSRQVRVRVNDSAGSPILGAAVEAIDLSFWTHATTGPDGTATLRVAADAKIRWVIGLKAGAGFDYFENYRSTPPADYPPLPDHVTLTLEGADTARVKAVESTGQPVPGVEIGLSHLSKNGKVDYAQVRRGAIASATTDHQGFATFNWLPKDGAGAFHFYIATGGNYTSRDQPYYQRGGPAKLTAHLLRDTRLSGTVRFPDGRPAAGLLIKAQGGPRSGSSINRAARTHPDGSYVLDFPSESSYIVAVVDENWAAPSLSNVIVREGRAQGGLDFTLTKGTLLHGQVSEAPDHRPAAGAWVWLTEEAASVLEDVRRSGFRSAQLMQSLIANADGRYHFRVGPGRYSLRSTNAGGTEPLTVEVRNEAEIVRDLALAGSVRATYFSGVVLEKTLTGDRPVAGAVVRSLRAGLSNSSSPSTADHEGRFRMLRVPGEQTLYGVSPDRSLAGLMPLPAENENVRLVMAKAPLFTGRVIDSSGTPQAKRSVGFRIDSGPDAARAGHQQFGTQTDDRGQFKISGAPVGSHVEVSVGYRPRPNSATPYPRRPNSPTPRIVVRFQVSDTDPLVIPDLIVPVEKPAK